MGGGLAVLAHDHPSWATSKAGFGGAARVAPDLAGDAPTAELADAAAIFIDGGLEAPLSVARRLYRIAPGAQVVVVAPPGDRERLQRSKLFTPGIGELWILGPEEVDAEVVERAVGIGGTRRRHQRRAARVSEQVAGLDAAPSRQPFLADQYLATLLELLPDPVLALDHDGATVFSNPPATELLGVEPKASLDGEQLRDRLRPADPEAWEALLERGRDQVARGQIELAGEHAGRVFSAAVAPVGGERPVRAVLLHEVTEQVRARDTLQRQKARLEEQGERLQEMNEELEMQAEELRMQSEELGTQADELRSLVEHRSRFYASMSHELRTPINAVLGHVDLLREGVFGPLAPRQEGSIERIQRAARHLLDLVNDVLDLSKVEAGKIDVRPEPLDVSELVSDLRATMEPLAYEKSVSLEFALEPSCAGRFSTDPRRLRQILMNLLSNAIRYGAGSPVEVRCEVQDGKLLTEVHDRGPGIPAAQVDRIFDEFVQLGDSEGGGTGLGLSISRAMARALGGELSVESEVGRGSVFRIEVPSLDPDDAARGSDS